MGSKYNLIGLRTTSSSLQNLLSAERIVATLGIKLVINQEIGCALRLLSQNFFWVSIVDACDLRTTAVIGGDLSMGETLMPSTVHTNHHTGAGNNSGHSRSTFYSKVLSKALWKQIMDNKNKTVNMLSSEYKDWPVSVLGWSWGTSWLGTCQSWVCEGLSWLEPLYVLCDQISQSRWRFSQVKFISFNVFNLSLKQWEATSCSRSSDKGCGHDGACARQQEVTHS